MYTLHPQRLSEHIYINIYLLRSSSVCLYVENPHKQTQAQYLQELTNTTNKEQPVRAPVC